MGTIVAHGTPTTTMRNGTKYGSIRLYNGTVSGNNSRTDCNRDASANERFIFSGAAPCC